MKKSTQHKLVEFVVGKLWRKWPFWIARNPPILNMNLAGEVMRRMNKRRLSICLSLSQHNRKGEWSCGFYDNGMCLAYLFHKRSDIAVLLAARKALEAKSCE